MALNAEDVITVDTGKFACMNSPTFKASELLERADAVLVARGQFPGLTTEGQSCKVLKPGDNWQRVKVRVKVELTVEYTIEDQ
ncbi:MAG: hypothetical protein SFY66_18630 [Oculatellaceae cyanobacterium bins.114]|nr:hypothetical protein [Oculatellaceae cyanobacterium bins.114]